MDDEKEPGIPVISRPDTPLGDAPLATSSARGSTHAVNLQPGIYYGNDKHFLYPEDIDDGKQHFGFDENKERGNWTGRLDFILACLGAAVGLGNVWRFPYLCYRNGGGAFFIPYVIMLVFVGIPLFYLELSLGQFCSSGPLTCWNFAPILKGIGIAQMVVSVLVAIYYNMIIATAFFYLFASFTSWLPWRTCREWWNTPLCSKLLPDVTCQNLNREKLENGTCLDTVQGAIVGIYNYTLFQEKTGRERILPSAQYYDNRVLSLSSGIGDMGPIKWELALCLLLAWIVAFICMLKGIKTTGKVVYFTALFPYVVLVILLGRGVSLPNAGKGIYFYLVPKWERLADAKVWNDAAVQIFFSLSNSWGSLIALASYNRFHNNCFRDTLIVSIGNCLTSLLAGFVIFSFLGFMAKEQGSTVHDVVSKGPGLAFIVYPDAVTRLPASPFWSIIFFAMLITLGLDSQFAMLETVLTSLMDQFKWLRPQKTKVIFFMCILFFFFGLPLCTHGGAYLLQLMDTYSGGWGLLLIGFTECIAVSWVYGANRYFEDIRIMLGRRPFLWWRICWQFLSPALILFILLYAWIDYSPAHYGDNYYYPPWADAIGWLMSLSSVIWIPIVAVYKVYKEEEGSIIERVRLLAIPTAEWGPALVKHRRLVDYVQGFVIDPWGTGTKKEKQGLENYGIGDNCGLEYGVGSTQDIRLVLNGSPRPVYGTPSISTISGMPESTMDGTFTRSTDRLDRTFNQSMDRLDRTFNQSIDRIDRTFNQSIDRIDRTFNQSTDRTFNQSYYGIYGSAASLGSVVSYESVV